MQPPLITSGIGRIQDRERLAAAALRRRVVPRPLLRPRPRTAR